ncbi:MAG: hypothetical protein EAX95_07150 [Candidatus Thorarchaeota archaeon]|nr:hypothetical protein [Candidatus Thorarchaeota archaeon]
MQNEIAAMLVTNFWFSLRVAPIVVVVATAIRTALLLTGKRRAFRTWTRNPLLSAVTIIFAPGMVINTGIRYGVCSLFGIDLEGIGGGSTYAEINLFIKVDRPPRVSILVIALFISTLLSIFVGFALMFLPFVLLAGAPVVLLSWYVALGVLFNSCIRGGDVSLLSAALKGRPRSGAIELVAAMAVLVLLYTLILGVPV